MSRYVRHHQFVFISPGAQVDHIDKEGNTPLHIASRYGHELLVETLINYGADPKRWVLVGQLRNFVAFCDLSV